MKRLLLHLGMAKTGTSSLQETLGRNHASLRSIGVVYPPFQPYNHSFKFQVLFKEEPENSFYYKQFAPSSADVWEQELRSLRELWVETFSSFEEGTCVISAENLPGMTEEEIQHLLAFVQPHFDEVSAIAYVRDPRDALRSRWEQDVKETRGKLSAEGLLQRAKRRLNYNFLDRWSAVLGRENITVRPFEPDRFVGGTLLADFFHHGKLGELPEFDVEEYTSNQSLGPEGAAFLLAFNRRYPQIIDGKLNTERGLSRRMHLLYAAMRAIRGERLDFEVRFSLEEAQTMNERISVLNQYLREDEQFAEVPVSELSTELPDPSLLSEQYYVDLINQLALKLDEFADVCDRLNPPAINPGKPFDRVYLHIGLGKTGTTAIQQMLVSRAQELEARGVHFPVRLDNVPDFRGNHSRILRTMFDSTPEKALGNIMAGRSSQDAAGQWAQELHAALDADLEATRARTLLLSAEGVAHLRLDDFRALIDWLGELADEVKVIACVRHPVEALASEMQQQLKTGAVLESLYADPPYYKLRQRLKQLVERVGKESLILYDFALAAKHPQGVRGAFLDLLELSLDLPGAGAEPANTSLTARAALILSAVNKCAPMLIDGKPNPDRPKGILAALTPMTGDKYEAPLAVRQRLMQKVEPELQWLRDTFGLELQAPPEPLANQGGIGWFEKLRAEISARRLLRRLASAR